MEQTPLQKMPVIMVIELVKDIVSWLNQFPSKGCIVPNMGPRTYLTGEVYDYKLHCKAEFGHYCQGHDDPDAKNRVDIPRTTGAIVLCNSGNMQGGYRLMSLNTG